MTDYWQNQRRMTAAQFTKAIKDLGMSQAGVGRFLGVSERHARRFVRGEAEVPEAYALLLRSLLFHNEQPIVPPWHAGQY